MDEVATCSLSVDDVKSLTIPKLKAELTRLNQPIGGLKLKAQFADALVAYIEQQQQQQPSSTPAQGNVTAAEEANAPETEVAPDAVERQDPYLSEAPPGSAEAEAAAQVPTTVSAEQPAQHDEPVEPELSAQDAARSTSRGTEETQDQEGESASPEPRIEEGASGNRRGDGIGQKTNTTLHREAAAAAAAAAAAGESTSATPTKQTGRQAEPMDMMDSGNNNNTANVVQQEKELTASRAKTPKTPSRKSRKRATRAGEDESARDGGGGDGKDVSGRGEEAGTPEEPKTKRSRRSSARGSKKASPDDPASGKGERSTGQDAKPQDGNGAVTTMDESSAGKGEGKGDDPMDVGEGAAPPSEPVSTAVKSLADAAEAMEEGVEKVQEEGKGGGAAEPVTIRVDNFVRPFTAPQAKKLLEEKAGAPVLEGCFWMDSIKTHCYATFDGQAAADKAIAGLQGLQWPVQSFKRLEAKIGDISSQEAKSRDDAMRSNRSVFSRRSTPRLGPRVTPAEPSVEPVGSPTVAGANGGALAMADAAASPARGTTGPHAAAALAAGGNLPSPVVRGRGSVQAPGVAGAKGGDLKANGDSGVKEGEEEEPEQLVLEDMFRKTEAKPSLYWLPLSEEEVGERKRKMKEDGVGPRTTPMPADHIETVTASSRGGGKGAGGWGTGSGDRRGYGGGGSGGAPYGRQSYGDGYYGRGSGVRRR